MLLWNGSCDACATAYVAGATVAAVAALPNQGRAMEGFLSKGTEEEGQKCFQESVGHVCEERRSTTL